MMNEAMYDVANDPGPAPSDISFSAFRQQRLHLLDPHDAGMRMVAALCGEAGAICTWCGEQSGEAPCQVLQTQHVDLVMAPPALLDPPTTHPDLAFAATHHLPVASWPWLLGMAVADQCICAIIGRDRQAAAAWLVRLLRAGGNDPSYAYDGPEAGGIHQGQSPLWVIGADVAYGSLRTLHPRLALITDIPEAPVAGFTDGAAIQRVFDAFIAGMDFASPWPLMPTLIFNEDDPGCRLLAARMASWPGKIVRYRLGAATAARGALAPGRDVTLRLHEVKGAQQYAIGLKGDFTNEMPSVLGAICAARQLGVEPGLIADAFGEPAERLAVSGARDSR